MSKQTQTTTTVWPKDSRIEPGREPANMARTWSPEFMTCPRSVRVQVPIYPAKMDQTCGAPRLSSLFHWL
ncbi:hypothetical protein NicSoilB4_33450 [Arthrobacter sp. NicSoilB4]|nr:hypothetical protein NicSoilB4_33450 [Arthrobacter sp. NicSoilB4]